MSYRANMRVRGGGLLIRDSQLLLIEFYTEEEGLHYVLPAGAVQPGESIRETARREIREEACIEVEVGPLVLLYEYAPHKDAQRRDMPPALSLIFDCRILSGEGRLPDCPDANQTGVRWIALDDLDSIHLDPPVQHQILAYAQQGTRQPDVIEEWALNGKP